MRDFSGFWPKQKRRRIRVGFSDFRMPDAVVRLRGNRNAAKHFVRAKFATNERMVIGGADDGRIWCWEAGERVVIEKGIAHKGGVYDIVWSSKRSFPFGNGR
jgi:hypothetical protein